MFDPTPILCRACGGPIADDPQTAWRCPHCDRPDELPRDLQARVHELRRRIELRARQLTRLTNVEAALALAFEEPGRLARVLTPMINFLTVLMIPIFVTMFSEGRTLSPTLFVMILGFPAAVAAAFYVSRHIYRREIRGHLQPMAPTQPGARARCRCCGAELPREFGPLVRCHHCHVHSLVTATQGATQARELAHQTRRHTHRLGDLAGHTARFGHKLDRVFGASFVVWYFVCLALTQLLR